MSFTDGVVLLVMSWNRKSWCCKTNARYRSNTDRVPWPFLVLLRFSELLFEQMTLSTLYTTWIHSCVATFHLASQN